jgi:HAD superfamily hydrolase (TIGR01509 family)
VAHGVIEHLAPELPPLDMAALNRHIEARMIGQRQAGRLVHYPAEAAREFWRATYAEFLASHLEPAHAAVVADGLLVAFTDLSVWALFPDVTPTLAALRRARLPLGLLSNWEDWLADLLVALGLGETFSHVLVSGELGLEKPDAAIFHHALARTGLAPADLLYIGDSLHHDIEPCVALGIPAVLIDRRDRYADDPAYHRLTDLRALPALIGLTSRER